jgi:hypothetical protein
LEFWQEGGNNIKKYKLQAVNFKGEKIGEETEVDLQEGNYLILNFKEYCGRPPSKNIVETISKQIKEDIKNREKIISIPSYFVDLQVLNIT